jgi:hypothetical protein
MNNGWGKMLEADVVDCKVLSQHVPKGTEEKTKNFNQDSRFLAEL